MSASLFERRVAIDRHVGPLFGVPARPFDAHVENAGRLAETGQDPRIVRGRIAAIGPGAAPQRWTSHGNDPHTRAKGVTLLTSEHPQPDPMLAAADLVDQ